MARSPVDAATFYDELADVYDRLYSDYSGEVTAQGASLNRLLHELGADGLPVVDLTAGVGTQAIGLADQGWEVAAFDLSAHAVRRGKVLAATHGHSFGFEQHDLADGTLPTGVLGPAVFLAAGNSLAFMEDDAIRRVAAAITGCSGPVWLVGSSRDYDSLNPAAWVPGEVVQREASLSVVHEWTAESPSRYLVTIDIQGKRVTTRAFARTRADLEALLWEGGLTECYWREPAASGFYQPVFVASPR